MVKILRNSLIWLLVVGSSCVYAVSNQQVVSDIQAKLKINLPDLVIDQIIATPIQGIYEVDSGRKVFYVDRSGDFALLGNLLDLKTKTSLTEYRTEALNKINWKQLPLDLALLRIKGNGDKNRIAIFTDPDCPFCKRLETETISHLNDIRIYYFLFPLPIHSQAMDHAQRILCAENPESAMLSFMTKDIGLGKNNTCGNINKLTKIIAVGRNIVQVSGTPTIVLPNGRLVSGLVPADYLSRLITENQPESALAQALN